MDYILQGKLSIAGVLFRFVNNELLVGTGISPKKFWDGLDKHAHELAHKNKKLLGTLTDGDLRSIIISGHKLNKSIKNYYQK